jgi:hypothetical protein
MLLALQEIQLQNYRMLDTIFGLLLHLFDIRFTNYGGGFPSLSLGILCYKT